MSFHELCLILLFRRVKGSINLPSNSIFASQANWIRNLTLYICVHKHAHKGGYIFNFSIQFDNEILTIISIIIVNLVMNVIIQAVTIRIENCFASFFTCLYIIIIVVSFNNGTLILFYTSIAIIISNIIIIIISIITIIIIILSMPSPIPSR